VALHRPSHLDHTSVLPALSLHVHKVQLIDDCSLDNVFDVPTCVPCSSGMSCSSHHANSCNSLFHRVCLIQRLAFQTNVDYATLHDSADGLSTWPAQITCVCHASSTSSAVDCAVSDTLVYHINHLMCDQLRLLWHQCLGHLHS